MSILKNLGKVYDVCGRLGWTLTDGSDTEIIAYYATDVGRLFQVSIPIVGGFTANVKSVAQNFDVNKQVEVWAKTSVTKPNYRDLVVGAEQVKEKLRELATVIGWAITLNGSYDLLMTSIKYLLRNGLNVVRNSSPFELVLNMYGHLDPAFYQMSGTEKLNVAHLVKNMAKLPDEDVQTLIRVLY